MVGKAFAKKDRNICYIATTYQQARDIAWNTLKAYTAPIAISTNESRLEIKVKTQDGGTSLITLRGWENIETLRGLKFDFIVVDEIASMRNFWENWEEIIRPTLTDVRGEALFISTPKGFNHFYDLCNKEVKDTDFKSFHFTSYDNPNVPSDEIDKAKSELTEDRFWQEYMADFRKMEGLVYKEFKREVHLFDDTQRIPVAETIAGIDFGFVNPAAVLTIKKDIEGNYWVTNEWYKTGQTDVQIAEYVAQCSFNKVYPDPESPSAIEELKRRGVNVREVVKNKDSIAIGIQKIRELLKGNQLKIHKNCLNLISEFETYSYPEKKELQNFKENPIKENDHALDALRYVVMAQQDERSSRTYAHHYYPPNLKR